MKQVVFKKGQALVVDAPETQVQAGCVVVEVHASCISPGTEMTSLNSTGKSLLEKAKAHPEKVKRAIERMKTEGILSVVQGARENASKEMACGYSAAGVVLEVGPDVTGFSKGMRVAVAGAGYANHAEEVVVPVNLAMKIPKGLGFKEASTCALGGIALQGVRRAEVTLGDIVAVIGCGALGLLALQLLKAAGCTVVAVDLDERRLELAASLGADYAINGAEPNLAEKITHFANGQGVDRVIITAATQSNMVLSQAFGMCRRKGRVVLVGVIGSEFNRADMYAKELDFVISTSYGPGRYDESYERLGNDYPYAYVRWTENRNMVAYLKLLSTGSVSLDGIIEASFDIADASTAYEKLKKGALLLVTLDYPQDDKEKEGRDPQPAIRNQQSDGRSTASWKMPENGVLKVGLVGAGSFVQSMHIPHLKELAASYRVTAVCNQTGVSARQVASMFEGCKAMTDYSELLASDVDMVLIGTRHNLHAEQICLALAAGKAVFVEKPMCITREEYVAVCNAVESSTAPFMVGYNRRFSPFAKKIREQVASRVNPLMIHYTMNGGYIPYDTWVHTHEGGGRVVGEGCHLFDLFRYLVGHPVVSVSVDAMDPNTESVRADDNLVATVKYADGSICTLLYTGVGSKAAPKERMEVFCDEQVYIADDYQKLTAYGAETSLSLKKPDKGHLQELVEYADFAKRGERFAIPWDELKETWEMSRQVADSVRN